MTTDVRNNNYINNRLIPAAPKKERILAIDFARGFALIFVVVIHILDLLSAEAVQNSLFARIIYTIGRLIGAPVFVFLMGVSLSFSTRATVKKGIDRGIHILIIAYILNFMRGTLPTLSGLQFCGLGKEDIGQYTPLFLLKEVDILQFAGVALILLVLIKNYLKKWFLWLLLGFITVFAFPSVQGVQSGFTPVDIVLDLIWGTDKYVYFPVLPWIVYPLFGMVYGHLLKQAPKKPAFFIQSALVGLVIVAAATPWFFLDPDFEAGNLHSSFFLFRMSTPGIIWYSGMICIWLMICYQLTVKIPGNPVFKRIYLWSNNVTSFYFIQWVLLGWISLVMIDISLIPTVILMIVMLFLTDRLTLLWNNYQTWRHKKS